MNLRFSKMHGLGNDFMVIDGVTQQVKLNSELICRLGDRHFGVGFDQLLLVEKTDLLGVDFRYRIFNCDGSEVEQCGNGARCFVRFVHEQGLTEKRDIAVETAKGVIYPRLEENGLATVNMGPPRFTPADIPFDAPVDAVLHALDVAGRLVQISVVSMGNPHAVQVVDSIDNAPVAELGPKIERHPRFPQKVNVGFMQVISRNAIRLRVYERAAGETMACGTGACAAVVAGIRRGVLDETVQVSTRGGDLTIRWAGGNEPVWMTGPAETVYEGVLKI